MLTAAVTLGLAGLGAAVSSDDGSEPQLGGPSEPVTPAEAAPSTEVADLECTQNQVGLVSGRGTITNRSERTASYMILVVFEQGMLRVGDGRALVTALQAGQTATWEASALLDVEGVTCRVQQVEALPQL